MLWSGPFNQLTNSKVEANFADARTYVFKNETIDHAYHLGFDLSVTKRYPVYRKGERRKPNRCWDPLFVPCIREKNDDQSLRRC